MVSEHPDTIVKFVRATLRGIDYIRTQPKEKVAQLLAKKMHDPKAMPITQTEGRNSIGSSFDPLVAKGRRRAHSSTALTGLLWLALQEFAIMGTCRDKRRRDIALSPFGSSSSSSS
jgi:ABC-type nitrate/sulfonate/bicarbonate transport system substrate-binding protein